LQRVKGAPDDRVAGSLEPRVDFQFAPLGDLFPISDSVLLSDEGARPLRRRAGPKSSFIRPGRESVRAKQGRHVRVAWLPRLQQHLYLVLKRVAQRQVPSVARRALRENEVGPVRTILERHGTSFRRRISISSRMRLAEADTIGP
jgi:hypothetical protein